MNYVTGKMLFYQKGVRLENILQKSLLWQRSALQTHQGQSLFHWGPKIIVLLLRTVQGVARASSALIMVIHFTLEQLMCLPCRNKKCHLVLKNEK
jgi:hypothetical protein